MYCVVLNNVVAFSDVGGVARWVPTTVVCVCACACVCVLDEALVYVLCGFK